MSSEGWPRGHIRRKGIAEGVAHEPRAVRTARTGVGVIERVRSPAEVWLLCEVSAHFRCGRHVREVERRFRVAPAVVPARKESLVLDEGTGKGRSKLIVPKWENLGGSGDWVEVRHAIARVESVVAHVFEGRTMERAASRRRHHVHYAASGATEFSLGVVPDDLEFLDQIDVGNYDVRGPANVCIDDAIKKVELRTVLLPVERGVGKARPRNPDIPFAATYAPILGGGDRRGSRSKGQQLRKVPAVQWQIVHSSFRNHGAQFARRSLEHHGFGADHDVFADRPDLQPDRLRDCLIDPYIESRDLRGLEAFCFSAQNIRSRLNVDEDKVPGGIRRDPVLDLRRLVGELDRGARHKSPGLIGYRPVHFARSCLRAPCRSGHGQQNKKNCCRLRQSHTHPHA